MTRRCLIILALVSSFILDLKSQNIEFIENKGQWDSRVKFRGDVPAGAFFIRSSGFTVLQQDASDLAAIHDILHHQLQTTGARRVMANGIKSHAYFVDFVGASSNIEIIPDKAISSYNNYFIGDDPSRWASNCRIYQAVTLKNVYPGIDVRYYTEASQMKYDIIVQPGADPSRIVMKYQGADKLEVKNKELIISTSVGTVRELDPYTYQYKSGVREKVNAKYAVKNNEVRFDIKNYDRNETLIIDPTLIFSSFSASTGSNWGFTATYGNDGSFYGGGINLASGFPVSPGAFQQTYSGGTGQPPSDISIIRLSPDGTQRIYATYIGGSNNEQPHSLIVDGAGNVVIAGRTNSSNYPTTGASPYLGTTPTGNSYEIVITKINATGTALIGSKKIGGNGDDGVNITSTRNGSNLLQQNYGDDGRSEVILDNAGNIYVASHTQSFNFPTTPGAVQDTIRGGQDAVYVKVDPLVTNLLASTYLGGNGHDAGYVLSLSPTNEVYIAGGTTSNNFPGVPATGVVGPSYGGGVADGYVSVLTNDGTSIIRSTYIGTSSTDQVFGVQFDRFGFTYIMGQTRGSWPVINAAYSVAGAPQFIAKLEPDFSSYIYSTSFGRAASTPNISPIAFLVDVCENVYVSGWGGPVSAGNDPNAYQSSGTSNLPITPDAIQSAQDGGDLYFFVLEKNAQSMLYGSYFGVTNVSAFPDHVDGGTSRFDRQGVIYQAVCAHCGGVGTFPTTPGVWGPANLAASSGGCNLGMIKIEFDFAGVESGVQSAIGGVPRDTAGCVPLTVDFIDTIANAVTYYWNFDDGSPVVITTTPSVSHLYTSVGLYNVMLISEDSSTCNIRDTSYITIRVGDLIASVDFNPVKLLPCDSLKYRFDNTSVAPPTRPFTSTSFIWDFGDGSPRIVTGPGPVFHTYSAPGSYNVTLVLQDTAYCNGPDSIMKTINIAPLVEARFDVDPAGCAPYNAVFDNESIAGQSFIWDFGDGSPTSTVPDPTHLYALPGTYNVTLIAIDSNTCNIADTAYATITVSPIPTASFTFSPVPPVENTPTTFINQSSTDAINFIWQFGDGDSLVTSSRAPVIHQYNSTGTFNACLIAINAAGCRDTFCLPVEAVVVSLVDVPNAFTPNSGDINSIVYVRGFGITKIKFIIWNRWGQKVFETDNKSVGWDGRYRGVLQPMDVYAYTLDVEFFDGKKATKKGDLTLIR